MTRLTDGEIQIVAEIEADCYGDDSEYDESEIAYPACDLCGKPSTGWSASGYTCETCYWNDVDAFRQGLVASGEPTVYCEELPDVGFPF